MRILVLALLFLVPSLSLAQAFETALPVVKSNGAYPAIEFMSAGESSSVHSPANAGELPPATPQALAMRVVLYRSGIYQSLVIETITTGLEGCCAKVAQVRSVDLGAFASYFGFKGEVSGFAFSGWSSPNSFRFTYQGKPFHATVANGRRLRVEHALGL